MAQRVQGFLLYRIYYGESLVYIGRTKQTLQSRIRGHLFAKPMHRTITIEQVTKIEYARFPTEADLNLYEIYFILKDKPPLNVDDKTRDDLTVELPPVAWKPFTTPLWDKWKAEIQSRQTKYDQISQRYRYIPEAKHLLRSRYRMGEIDEDELRRGLLELDKELSVLYDKMHGEGFW